MRSSSHQRRSLFDTVREAFGLMTMHWARRNAPISFGALDATIAEYNAHLSRFGKPGLEQLRALEIGFGARPFRLTWFYNNGIDVVGVDLDRPLLKLTTGSLFEIARNNGIARALKSALRYHLSDKAEWTALARAIEVRGRKFRIPVERLIVADASDAKVWRELGSVDFVYSEDVFEHIPKESLGRILGHMADALAPDGIAVIRPMVFTGICGGHHLEWYPHTMGRSIARITEPWEHLRQNRHRAATYLNGLTRADYVALFSERFEILDHQAMRPDLGRQYMTEDIRAELQAYGDDELFSNSVLFILRPMQQRR